MRPGFAALRRLLAALILGTLCSPALGATSAQPAVCGVSQSGGEEMRGAADGGGAGAASPPPSPQLATARATVASLLDSSVAWWKEHGPDRDQGGFYTTLDQFGAPLLAGDQADKFLVPTARQVRRWQRASIVVGSCTTYLALNMSQAAQLFVVAYEKKGMLGPVVTGRHRHRLAQQAPRRALSALPRLHPNCIRSADCRCCHRCTPGRHMCSNARDGGQGQEWPSARTASSSTALCGTRARACSAGRCDGYAWAAGLQASLFLSSEGGPFFPQLVSTPCAWAALPGAAKCERRSLRHPAAIAPQRSLVTARQPCRLTKCCTARRLPSLHWPVQSGLWPAAGCSA